jgi:hypothetical protein
MELSDDPDIGPLFPFPNKYSIAQLHSFSDKLTQLRFWFTEKAPQLQQTDERIFKIYRSLLFDNQLIRAHFLIRRAPSKNLLLRLLQRFLDCLKENNAYIEISEWFIIPPSLPPISSNVTPTLIPTPASSAAQPRLPRPPPPLPKNFDPNKPSTSRGIQ